MKAQTLILWVVLLGLVIMAWTIAQTDRNAVELQYEDFMQHAEDGNIKTVVWQSNGNIRGEFAKKVNGKGTFKGVILPPTHKDAESLRTLLKAKNPSARLEVQVAQNGGWASILLSALPFLLLIGFWIFFMKQMQGGGNKALSFGKSKAKLNTSGKKVTFKDVAGIDEAKEEVQEIVEFLKDPRKFQKLGGRIPKGVLLVGPAGCGKTLTARAVAGEAEVPFFSISGSDFVEMFVGVGASRVRDLFEQGKKNAPCIIFIDEIDAVGRHRGAGLGGGHDEREQTLNQLLVEMDGFEQNSGVILIAATNRPDVLDPALVRPGRFDRQVIVSRPDLKGRHEILAVHAKKIPLAGGTDLEVVARGTPGFTGADLANLLNEAALAAARKNRSEVTAEDIDSAKDKVLMGPERRSVVMSKDELRITAYHEAGHTLVALELEEDGADPVHKVTIIPRGMALGATWQLPLNDKHGYSKKFLLNRIAIAMGGRIAEELTLGKENITTGASNDIENATSIAERMVKEWGMASDELGPMKFGGDSQNVFLGKKFGTDVDKNYSEDTARKIDQAIRKFLDANYARAFEIITSKRAKLEAIALALIEKETLNLVELKQIMQES